MSIRYTKSFASFSDGMRELLSIAPDLLDYTDNVDDRKSVVINLLNLLIDEVPSTDNKNYPNTMSLNLSSLELEFVADNHMTFIHEERRDENDEETIKHIFIFAYDGRNGRKAKRLREGFDKHEWSYLLGDLNNTNRVFNTEKDFKEEETTTKEDTNVQNLSNKNYQDYSEAVPLPTFIQDDEEPPKQEEKSTSLDSQLTLNIGGHAKFVRVDRLKRNAGKYAALVKDPLDPIDIANRYSTLTDFYRSSDFRENMDYWYSENKPTQALQEVESIILSNNPNIDSIQEQTEPNIEVQQVDARNIPSRLKGLQRPVILPNGKVAEETKYLQEPTNSIGLEELDPAFFSIRPGQDQATVIIKHEGREFPYNVNEQRAGIIRDPANKKITIDHVVYDYRVYKAYKLPDDFEPDNATYVGATPNMIHHQQLPDEAFVPRETIMKNADIDIDAIQEEAIKRERFKERITGIKTPPLWNRDTVQPPPQQSSGNVLRKGKAFVIEKNHGIPKPQVEIPYDEYGPQQSVQITNEDQIYN